MDWGLRLDYERWAGDPVQSNLKVCLRMGRGQVIGADCRGA